MKTLYLECNMGASGDMLLSALYELLPGKEAFLHTMNCLGLYNIRLSAQPAVTCGITGSRVVVEVCGEEELSEDIPLGHEAHAHTHSHTGGHAHEHANGTGHSHGQPHGHTTLHDITELISGLPLPAPVRKDAAAVYARIAAAEARVHGAPVEQVHFHEVGALDAVADIAGVCYAIHLLGPARVVASPVHVGSGQVRCAHGVLPVPAPATAELLRGVPCYGGEVQGELCTPTGAALLAHFAATFGPMPPMEVEQVGYGIGKKTFASANCMRAFWGAGANANSGEVVELCCNVDDMTAEEVAFACTQLLAGGALDVYTTPCNMKKGRAGTLFTVLCKPEHEQETVRLLFSCTMTNGLRARRCGKYWLSPAIEMVETDFGPVRFKCAQGWGAAHRKPEYEDVARIAREEGLPFRRVWEELTAQEYAPVPAEGKGW